MNMESIAWFGAAWLVASLTVSLLVGRMLRYTTAADDALPATPAAARRKAARRPHTPRTTARRVPAEDQRIVS